jgi:tRNA (guanine26-N2/guanine27-N2)-dimethyltransferase
VPLFYEQHEMVQVCKTIAPKSETFRSAILNAGYRCSSGHCSPGSFKTDAPLEFIWDIIRTLV